ncbi:hypothetical protein HPB50_001312 [Hyalomma asiaticum]|uniref:Uncharacterized protein n=1 Tax=Hyalomma asiaticum TaxID=266040 RepID=A0ACB7SCV0_HYAAI|nr:hypothetical protein HPB50_001312 [Hyalomma asiaticum]
MRQRINPLPSRTGCFRYTAEERWTLSFEDAVQILLQGTHKIEVPFPISHPVDLRQHSSGVPDCSGFTNIPTPVQEGTIKQDSTSSSCPTTNAKTAPREVSWQRAPAQLFPFQPPTHPAPCPPPPLNTNTDPCPEIARLRRDMEERHAQTHAQLHAAIEHTNARIQAAIESARQESLALRQEIITLIHASEERTQALLPS